MKWRSAFLSTVLIAVILAGCTNNNSPTDNEVIQNSPPSEEPLQTGSPVQSTPDDSESIDDLFSAPTPNENDEFTFDFGSADVAPYEEESPELELEGSQVLDAGTGELPLVSSENGPIPGIDTIMPVAEDSSVTTPAIESGTELVPVKEDILDADKLVQTSDLAAVVYPSIGLIITAGILFLFRFRKKIP